MASTIQFDKIGKLGFGYMRLPKIDGQLDEAQVNKMVDAFMSSGGTYYDAAYVYEGAEVALNKTVIKRYPRDKFQIATKIPVGMISKDKPLEHFIETSLERLGTDYIDFYLLHGLNSDASKLAEENGAWEFLANLKAKGVIRHIAFSFHGTPEDLDEILTKHPETEMVMPQINYWDWDNPKNQARRIHEFAVKHDTPLVIMEPLLGGKLASEDSPIAEILHTANPNVSIASWAMRFCAQLENNFVTLSGMSTFDQMEDNIKTFTDLKPLSNDEMAYIDKALEALKKIPTIYCTECEYCKDCPVDINISGLINLYNAHMTHKTMTNLAGSYGWISGGRKANTCTKCGACEKACPQNLEIIDTLEKVSALFD